MSKRMLSAALPVALLMVGFAAGRLTSPGPVAHAQGANRVFELRTYTTNEGKLPALQARFRDHTTQAVHKARDDQHRLLDTPGRRRSRRTR